MNKAMDSSTKAPVTGIASEAGARGLECTSCGCKRFRVIYTRPASGGRLLRRRECRLCGKRLLTWEKAIGY